MDILHAKVEKGKQNDNSLLFIPCDIEENREVIDIVCSEDFVFCHIC